MVSTLGWAITACGSDLSLGHGSDIHDPIGQDAAASGPSPDESSTIPDGSSTADGPVVNDRPVPVTFVLRNTGSKHAVTQILPNNLRIWVTESGTNERKYILPWFPRCEFVCDPAECVGYTDAFTPPATDVAPGDEVRVTWDGVNWSDFQTREDGGQCNMRSPLPNGVYSVLVYEACSPDALCGYGAEFTYPPAGDVVIKLRSFPDECLNDTDCTRLNE
jgi:hypothetical protein